MKILDLMTPRRKCFGRDACRSKYEPHQGTRERNRRLSQVAMGQLRGSVQNPRFIEAPMRAIWDYMNRSAAA